MDARQLLLDTLVHIPPLHALNDLSAADAERSLPGAPHAIAGVVAHMAFWQDWFIRRCNGAPDPMAASAATGWPAVAPGSWPALRTRFVEGLEAAAALNDRSDRAVEPAIEFPPLAGYTIREALIHVAQHNSHHLGQIILLRQLMGLWPPPSGGWTW